MTLMNWHSFGDFLAMGGYARYVWGSVLVFVAALAVEWVALGRRRRAAMAQVTLLRNPATTEKRDAERGVPA